YRAAGSLRGGPTRGRPRRSRQRASASAERAWATDPRGGPGRRGRRRERQGSVASCGHPASPAREVHVNSVRIHADRKSTRLNSSHSPNSYAVLCFNKKKKRKWSDQLTGRPDGRVVATTKLGQP